MVLIAESYISFVMVVAWSFGGNSLILLFSMAWFKWDWNLDHFNWDERSQVEWYIDSEWDERFMENRMG